jgi:hypothetical protein
MSAENEAYSTGIKLLRQLRSLRSDVGSVDASDTQCKERAMQLLNQAETRLREALDELSGLV